MPSKMQTAPDGQSGKFGLTTGYGIGYDVEGLQDGENLLINSAGKVNQRNYVSGAVTTGGNQFTVDRWFVPTTGQALSWSEAADGNYRLFTAPASGMVQVIEAAKIQTGKYVASWAGSGTLFVNGVERFNGVPFDLAYNAATNAVVKFVGQVSKMRLERGRVPTRFNAKDLDFDTQLEDCRLFYRDSVGMVNVVGACFSNNRVLSSVLSPERMRAYPTVISTALILTWLSNGAAYDTLSNNTTIGVNHSYNGVMLSLDVPVTSTAGQVGVLSTKSGSIALSAELTS